MWRPQLRHFGPERRAVAFDYPGYGDSDPAPEAPRATIMPPRYCRRWPRSAIGKRTSAACRSAAWSRLRIHHAAPERCASLILADTFASHPDGQAIYERSLAASEDMRALAEGRVDVLLAQPADPAVRSEVVETMARIDPAAYPHRRRGGVARRPGRSRRGDSAPALMVCGAEDRVTPPGL